MVINRKLRFYIDTSVIGGVVDDEFKYISKQLVERFKNGELIAVISEITEIELEKAPPIVKNIFNEIFKDNMERVSLTEEAFTLAQKYISENILEENKIVDAQHIAIATINNVDCIVSWNFRHIVNIEKIKGFNAVNLKMGYPIIDIRSPSEVIRYEDKEI